MNPKKKSRRCRASASIQALDLAISRFIYSFDYNFLFLMATLAFNKILGLVLAWKSGRKVSLLPLGPSCPLQIILLSDMVG